MSGITTIWNRYENFQDTSEVWNPLEGDGQELLRNGDPGCYPKHVIIKDKVGYMIMPGIYYFGDFNCKARCPEIMMFPWKSEWNERWTTREAAVMGSRITDHPFGGIVIGISIMYLAVDKENIEILKKIHQTIGHSAVLAESGKLKEREKHDSCTHLLGEKKEQADIEIHPESEAEELMPGIGIRKIRVGLKYIFMPRKDVMEYEYAYKLGDKLVLINGGNSGYVLEEEGRKEYDLRILEELTVRRTEQLRCGFSIDRDYHLIDCGAQKAKQVLTPEAYELLRECDVVPL